MSEKEKPKRSTKLGFTRSCLAFALYPLLIFKLMAMGLVYWAIGGYVKPSLDPQYIPTAEYLLENTNVENVNLNSLSVLSSYIRSDTNVCLMFITFSVEDYSNLLWAEIYINEQVVRRFHPYWTIDNDDNPNVAVICFDGHLDSGLHIIEFRAKEHLFAEPYYIQRWAIEIP